MTDHAIVAPSAIVLARRLTAEFLGSLLLAGVVIGSGILAADLSADDAVSLLGNTAATGAILWVLVATLGPVSGAHFNPAVTAAFLFQREIAPVTALGYVLAQIAGCVAGAWLAHAMFELPLLQIAATDRSGAAKMLAEAVATFALVFAIFGALRHAPRAVPAAVALTITAGYWWTASTSFANPAITVARAMTDTFAGVRPADAPGFIAAQFAGALAAAALARFLFSPPTEERP